MEDSRVGCMGGLHCRGDLHVVLVPSHCDCSSAECYRGGQLQLGRQGPVL